MKTKLFLALAVATVLGLSSCDNASKLANNVQGTWQGETTQMSKGKPDKQKDGDRKDKKDGDHKDKKGDDRKGGQRDGGKVDMTCIPTITFTLDQTTNGGTLNITAQYTVSQPVFTKTDSIAPVKATISGNATASGTWLAKDEDDIRVTIDPTKINVAVDPSSLSLDYAVLTDRPASELDSIKANVAANIEPMVRTMIQERISRIHEFEDVKFPTKTTMKMEIGHAKMTFTKK